MEKEIELALKIIESISTKLGLAVEQIIPAYAKWFMINAISWSFFGIFIIIISFYSSKRIYDHRDEVGENIIVVPIIILFIGLFIGGLFVFANISNIIAPEGYAIHQLIEDVIRKSR